MTKALYEAKQLGGTLLNANESYRNIDQDLLMKCKDALDDIAFHRYPQDDAYQLRLAYANYAGVDVDCVMAGNGSDELIGLLISLILKGNKTLYTLDPDFSMYDYYTAMADGKLLKYDFQPDTVFDVQAFIEYGRRKKIDMILFSNPNNPTGAMMKSKTIKTILEAFPCCPVVIDEAYVDFSDENMIPYLDKHHNLIILRTMSKAFGMAGIRCGFMITNKQSMKKIMPYKVPYNVNSVTQAIGTILLQEPQRSHTFVEEISKARDAFFEAYVSFNLEDFILYPSKANYLYGRSKKKHVWMQALEAKNIHIRDYKDTDTFRITIGSPKENKMVLDTIKEVFVKETI